jgi:hypothetical protein
MPGETFEPDEPPKYLKHDDDPTHPAGNKELAEIMANAENNKRVLAVAHRKAEKFWRAHASDPDVSGYVYEKEAKNRASRAEDADSRADRIGEEARAEFLNAHPELSQSADYEDGAAAGAGEDSHNEAIPPGAKEDWINPIEETGQSSQAVAEVNEEVNQDDKTDDDRAKEAREGAEYYRREAQAAQNEEERRTHEHDAKVLDEDAGYWEERDRAERQANSPEEDGHENEHSEESEPKSIEQLKEESDQADDKWNSLRVKKERLIILISDTQEQEELLNGLIADGEVKHNISESYKYIREQVQKEVLRVLNGEIDEAHKKAFRLNSELRRRVRPDLN